MADRDRPDQPDRDESARRDDDVADRDRRDRRAADRHVDITPALRLDVARLMPAVERQVDSFIADREAAGLPLPDRQALLDRAAYLLANIDPNKADGADSLARNRRLAVHHRDVPPYFGMGTEP